MLLYKLYGVIIVSQVSKLLSDDVVSLAESGLKRIGKVGIIAHRLQLILAAKSHSITDVCRIHGISRTTLTDWIKRLSTGVVEALGNKPKKPKSPLTQHEPTIQKWIGENPNITVRELLIKTKDEIDIDSSQTAMRRVIKKLRFSASSMSL